MLWTRGRCRRSQPDHDCFARRKRACADPQPGRSEIVQADRIEWAYEHSPGVARLGRPVRATRALVFWVASRQSRPISPRAARSHFGSHPASLHWFHLGPGTRKPRRSGALLRVSEGTRTPDRLDHNPTDHLLLSVHGPDSLGLLLLGVAEFSSVWTPNWTPASEAKASLTIRTSCSEGA